MPEFDIEFDRQICRSAAAHAVEISRNIVGDNDAELVLRLAKHQYAQMLGQDALWPLPGQLH